MSVTYDFGAGGFDLHLTLPALAAGQWVAARCNAAFTAADAELAAPSGTIRLERSAGGFILKLFDAAGVLIESYGFSYISAQPVRVRLRARNEAVSLLLDDWWAVTLWLKRVKHPETAQVWLLASGAITVTDIRLVELSDGQDQVLVDIDSSASNAISAVLQQRPILQWSLYDGSRCFAYTPPVATHDVTWFWSGSRQRGDSDRAASDGLVYHSQGTAVVVDPLALAQIGFVTRAFRCPELEHGAITAAQKTLEAGRQEGEQVKLARQLVPALEMYDRVAYGAVVGGGVAYLGGEMIVDDLTFDLSGPQARMDIGGRSL